jgi:hypothetical protein
MSAHGDRVPSPKPLSEVLREQGIDISVDPDYGEQGDERPLVPSDLKFDELAVGEDYTANQVAAPLLQQAADTYGEALEEGRRLQAIAIAASSFGAAGCFDDDLLLRRSEAVRNYITNGYE